jgi:cellulose synthase/poly-beta-1,6-N-acetylglucosamine synthase-like glycosyltransferase
MSAIYLGKKHAKADIIMITDANATFDKNVLKEMMPHFENPKNGAVGGRYCVQIQGILSQHRNHSIWI